MQWWLLLFNYLCQCWFVSARSMLAPHSMTAWMLDVCVCVRLDATVTFVVVFFFFSVNLPFAALCAAWLQIARLTQFLAHTSIQGRDGTRGKMAMGRWWRTKPEQDYIFQFDSSRCSFSFFFFYKFGIAFLFVEWICKFWSRRGHAKFARARSLIRDGQKWLRGSNMHNFFFFSFRSCHYGIRLEWTFLFFFSFINIMRSHARTHTHIVEIGGVHPTRFRYEVSGDFQRAFRRARVNRQTTKWLEMALRRSHKFHAMLITAQEVDSTIK